MNDQTQCLQILQIAFPEGIESLGKMALTQGLQVVHLHQHTAPGGSLV